MKTFTVWYSVTESWKVHFEACCLEEAQEMVKTVNNGDEPTEWLWEEHNGWEKNKGLDLEFDMNTIEEI